MNDAVQPSVHERIESLITELHPYFTDVGRPAVDAAYWAKRDVTDALNGIQNLPPHAFGDRARKTIVRAIACLIEAAVAIDNE